MAIKPCKECGAPVSDKAEGCPMCGAKQPKETSVLTWVCVCILGLAAIIWMYSDKTPSTSSGVVSTTQATESENVKPKNWQYEASKDEMRGIESRFATTVSTNTVDFDFPYNGGSKLILALRKRGSEVDVMVSITKGQILCGIQNCEAAFKFDDGAVQSITMSEPDSHASDLLFVAYDKTESKIISQLKNSKKLVIEVPFYQQGKKQFTFDVSGLEWN
ncbi:zinc ribbon domain-containing protein [Acinetobacter lwoffii]|uniref:zinc ribbon domain-containing protein n=1 Tax=Acinetobacter lwoffii TaxID=28090 RepID=UPI0003A7ED4F|nr:zinc ribbon domain-containing protein [Acinetobacter lwoffii]